MTCNRCSGKGIIDRFRHIVGGICFRCWGSGVDPQTAQQLRTWLERARVEWRSKKAALKATDSLTVMARLMKELVLIEKLGKANKAKLSKLESDYKFGQGQARNQARFG